MAIERFKGLYSWLSNFHMCLVVYEGIEYPSSEHAYQAAKSLVASERIYIKSLDTPSKAKRAGKKVTLRPDWEQKKLVVMEEILRIKFSNPRLKALLMSTGDEELIEGNTWHDHYWGVCGGKGKNHLGKILMKIRSEFLNAVLAATPAA